VRKEFVIVTASQEPPDRAHDEWVRALRRREPAAWERLQRLTLDRVFGYLYLRAGRREDAEDLTVEVFAAAYAAIDRFRGDAELLTWLFGIARRKLIDAARYRRRHPEVLETELDDQRPTTNDQRLLEESEHWSFVAGRSSPDATPHDAVERRDTAARLRRIVLSLPEPQREALWLRCIDELSLAEIARVLGRSEDAVKGLLHRAKTTVQERLAAEERCCESGRPATNRRGIPGFAALRPFAVSSRKKEVPDAGTHR
jgi:RNA polymerase sigma-70 factor (ECF subfamily)